MEELIIDIRNIAEHCINEYEIVTSSLEETIEDLGYDEALSELQDLTDEMFRYYKRILKYIDNANLRN